MAEDEFFIAGSHFETVELKKDRVQLLFGVEVTVTFEDVLASRRENAKIRLTSLSDSAKINKAQKYLGESENFVKEKITLNENDFKMVLHKYDEIEKFFETHLTLCDTDKIVIQGNEKDVKMTLTYIQNLLMSKDIVSRPKPDFVESTDNRTVNILIEETNRLDISDVMSTSDNLSARGGYNSYNIKNVENLENLKDQCLFGGIEDQTLETDSYKSPTEVQGPPSYLSPASGSDCSSPENETDRILSDPEHSNHIEKALRLGYSESQIAAVLKKLGKTAVSVDPNTLLSELIQQGAITPDSDITTDSPALDLLSNNNNNENNDAIELEDADHFSNLKHIVIDGSNVAMSHGNKEVFSCRGIKLAVDYFRQRGHKKITVFVPQWRKESSRPDAQIKDQEILHQLEKEKVLVFTPSRRRGGRRMVCYDDRYILDLAHVKNGIVVSNDTYRDLHNEKQEYKKIADDQLLQYLFVDDKFMPPADPLGKHGPTLDNFLRIKPVVSEPLQPCPYGKKCTYGNKCRFAHPERGNRPQRSITDILSEQSNQKLKERAAKLEVAEKKKKELMMKKKLKRTVSMFPTDIASNESRTPESVDEYKSLTRQTSEKTPEKSDLNAFLDEHRRKLAEKLKTKSPVPTVEIQKAPVANIDASNIMVHIEPQVTELKPFVSNLPPSHYPLQSTNQSSDSGLLQLVKKLSDEANDNSSFYTDRGQASPGVSQQNPKHQQQQLQNSQYQRETPQLQKAAYPDPLYQSSFLSSQQLNQPYVNPQVPSDLLPYPHQTHLPPSSDYGICYSGPPTYMRQNAVPPSYEAPLQSYPFVDNSPYTYQRGLGSPGYNVAWNTIDPRYQEHVLLSRRVSHPDQQIGTSNPMMRQNSSSDPQLHDTHRQNQTRMPHLQHRGIGPKNQIFSTDNQITSGILSPPTQPPSPFIPAGYYKTTDYSSQVPGNIWSPTYMPKSSHTVPTYPHPTHSVPAQNIPSTSQISGSPVGTSYQSSVSYPKDAEILPTDPRFSAYSQYCGVFPEPKVRAVMNMYPNEKDPNILLSILASMT